ncbi:MAG: hypothetical protein QMC83_08950 [Thermodesulfovibrionales bacterium]|nr:hypothetical protein [Thermodesulfovibrionales bacterium]
MLKDYTIIVKKSGEQYVSLCLENMVVGCGMTKDEAIENVRNAIESYVNSLEEGMSLERPVPLKLLHEFLVGEEEEIGVTEKASALKVLTYG